LTKRKTYVAALALAAAGLGVFGGLEPAAALSPGDCATTVHPHTYPGVINDPSNGIGVETGEYHIHTDCIK